MNVLRILNIAPTQLHPNSWAILQAFRIICQIFGLTPTPESFLYYYNTHPSTPVGWLSLSSRSGNVRFAAFTTSYKNFKDYYFKVFVEPDDRDLFYNADGTTKFPFHWTEKPTSLDHRFWDSLSPFDKEILMVVNQLSCRLPTRELVALYGSSKQWADLNGEHLFLFSCLNNNLLFLMCLYFTDIVLMMDPSLKKYMNTLKRQANKSKISMLAGTTPISTDREVVPVEPAVAPVQGKKRGRPAKSPRFEARTLSESPVSMLGLSVRVAPTMQFDLRPEDEGVLLAVPCLDLIEEVVELQCRAAVVSRAFGDELKRVKTVPIPKLKKQLNDSVVSLKEALKATEEAQNEARLAREEQETLKATLTEVMAERADAVKAKEELVVAKESLGAQVEQLQGFMLKINEESFKQGVRQVAFFHGVPANDEQYDSNMDVVDGQLMPLGGEEGEDDDQTMNDPIAKTARDDLEQPDESTQPDDAIDIV